MGIDNPVHLIFLAAVALLVLGPRRLPEVARSLGKGIREFREAMSDGSATGFMHEHHGVPGVPVSGSAPVSGAATPVSGTVQTSGYAAPVSDAEVVADHSTTVDAAPIGGGWGALHTDTQDILAASGIPGDVDPVEPVRSGDAPDRRPL
jgi:sec-independent protein translocase protein TatA